MSRSASSLGRHLFRRHLVYFRRGEFFALDFALQGTVAPVVVLTPIESWRQQWFGTTNTTGNAADTYVGTSDGMAEPAQIRLGPEPACRHHQSG